MSRNPGESAEQWSTRASVEYNAAWNALGNEPHRLMLTGISQSPYPIPDRGYDNAMDRLAAADCERGDAAIALDREQRISDHADRIGGHVDHRLTDKPPPDQSRV